MTCVLPATVLIIEDSEISCELLMEYLASDGFAPDYVLTGADALNTLRKKKYDIALIDIDLPDHDGIDLIEQVKKLDPEIMFAMITGHNSAQKASDAFKKGAFDYYVKPFIVEDIQHGLRAALENKELKRQLQSSQSQIIQQEKMVVIGQLAAGVAHEINNPVGFITSNLSTLAKYFDRLSHFLKAQDEALKEMPEGKSRNNLSELRKKSKIDYVINDIGSLISESLEGADRIKKIVQDLKLFSRQDSEKKSLADVNTSIESALNIVWNELKYKCTIQKELGELKLSLCYPQKLSQVFINIFVNAGQAMKERGIIRVRSWHENGCNRIDISDNGCGMPPEVSSRVFDPFFSTKKPGEGTGLGMSIAAEIVHKHGGKIEVDSKENHGTTFHIYLPVKGD